MSRAENTTPRIDGERATYHPLTSAERCHRDLVLYVNGVRTTGQTHRETAEAIADGIGLPVDGIYNLTGTRGLQQRQERYEQVIATVCPRVEERHGPAFGRLCRETWAKPLRPRNSQYFVADFVQAKGDWWSRGRPAQTPRVTTVGGMPLAVAPPPQYRSKADRHRTAQRNLGRNRAALALYKAMYEALSEGRGVHLVGHSQGCLIARNAVDGLGWVLDRPIDEVFVYPLASPATWWPVETGFKLRGPYTVVEDLVTFLGIFQSRRGSAERTSIGGRWGVSNQHDVQTYKAVTRFFDDLRRDLGVHDDVPHPYETGNRAGMTGSAQRGITQQPAPQ